jgi:tetratricopeptide (TPR) repeat protein
MTGNYHYLKKSIFLIPVFFLLCCQKHEDAGGFASKEEIQKDSVLLKTAIRLYTHDSVVQSKECLDKVMTRAEATGNQNLEIQAKNLLGYIYLYWSDYEASLDMFLSSLSLAREQQEPYPLITALHGLGRTYNLISDSAKAISVLNEALEISIKNNLIKEAGKMHNELGNTFTQAKDYKKALFHQYKGYEFAIQTSDTISMIYLLNNIGQGYSLMGEYRKSVIYFEKGLELNKNRNEAQSASAILGNLGEVYLNLEDYLKAVEFILKSLEISERQGFRVFTKDNYLLLSRTHEKLHQYPEALAAYKRYSELRDSLFNEDKSRAIESITNKYIQEEKDKKITMLTEQARNRTLLYRFSIMAVILFVTVLILIVISLRLRIKLHKQEKKKLDETISHKNRELVTMMLQTHEKLEMMAELEKNIDKLANSEVSDYQNIANDIRGKIRWVQNIDSDWQEIKTHFEQVHPDFFKTLLHRHPSLTQNDLKLCAYIRINLTTKEIARLFHISERSVQTSRYRIRKKMLLTPEIGLSQYIADL